MVKNRSASKLNLGKQRLNTTTSSTTVEEEVADESSKPFSKTLVDLQLEANDRKNIAEDRRYLCNCKYNE